MTTESPSKAPKPSQSQAPRTKQTRRPHLYYEDLDALLLHNKSFLEARTMTIPDIQRQLRGKYAYHTIRRRARTLGITLTKGHPFTKNIPPLSPKATTPKGALPPSPSFSNDHLARRIDELETQFIAFLLASVALYEATVEEFLPPTRGSRR